jgi:hypothetical protein
MLDDLQGVTFGAGALRTQCARGINAYLHRGQSIDLETLCATEFITEFIQEPAHCLAQLARAQDARPCRIGEVNDRAGQARLCRGRVILENEGERAI